MKQFYIVLAALLVFSNSAVARDSAHMVSIAEAMQSDKYQEKLGDDIKFYFGEQSHPAVAKNLGEYVTNKKTNAFGKSDAKACNWVLLSALLTLQDRARSEGGNAVINISSYYKKNEFVSSTEIECHAGQVIAGIALKGEVVKLK